jgi:RNA polymerase sigma factor (sigma-70 family)
MDDDIKELTLRAKGGDAAAFGELYAMIWRDLYRFALYMLQNREDAEDMVQEAARQAFVAIKGLRGENAVKAWFMTILVRCCRHKLRERAKERADTPLEELPEELLPPAARNEDDRLLVMQALESLRTEERFVVVLAVEGLYSSVEIAAMLGRPGGTVRSQLHRGLKKLKSFIGEE